MPRGSKKRHFCTTSPWDATALRARCAEPEVTETIPAALLRTLLQETRAGEDESGLEGLLDETCRRV